MSISILLYIGVPLGLLSIVAIVFYLYLTWKFDYWTKRGVNGPKPKPLFGTFPGIVTNKRNFVYELDDVYKVFKGRERFVGVFTTVQPQLMLIEPDLIQQILISDFRSFHNNESSRWVNREVEPIAGANPFVLTDDIWKEKRAEIVQGLTISKIKTCYPIVKSACQKLTTYIKEHAHYSEKGFDVNDLSLRYTGEVVCDTVWGIEAGSFKDKTNCTFVDTSKKTINQTYYSTIFYYASQVLPFIRNFYSVRFFPVESDKFFSRFLQDAIDVRSKNGERGDFLQYMINLQEKKHLSNTDLVGHQLTFLFDGFETSAVVIAHTLLCIARNPQVQQTLRQEITDNLQEDGFLSFDNLQDLPYLDCVMNESLRVFTPLSFMSKICTSPYDLINSKGDPVHLYPGNIVHIPIHSIHMDERFYDEPGKFKPERFSEENGGVKKYKDMGVYFPFGDGPRICLGMKFGITQSKAAIVEIVKNFQVGVHGRTRSDNYCAPGTFILSLDGGIHLKFKSL